jgi:hypothetical protein
MCSSNCFAQFNCLRVHINSGIIEVKFTSLDSTAVSMDTVAVHVRSKKIEKPVQNSLSSPDACMRHPNS